jgi:hypothetical protein
LILQTKKNKVAFAAGETGFFAENYPPLVRQLSNAKLAIPSSTQQKRLSCMGSLVFFEQL